MRSVIGVDKASLGGEAVDRSSRSWGQLKLQHQVEGGLSLSTGGVGIPTLHDVRSRHRLPKI
jgi:hypothetical protein